MQPHRLSDLSFFRSAMVGLLAGSVVAGMVMADEPRCIVVELFAVSSDAAVEPVAREIERFMAERGGLVVVRRFVDTSAEDRAAVEALARLLLSKEC